MFYGTKLETYYATYWRNSKIVCIFVPKTLNLTDYACK